MGKTTLHVTLLSHTPDPDNTVAMAARLCYSDDTIDDLARGVASRDQGRFIRKLMSMGHLSPVEHVSFTFGIEGVSRALLAQITRHRIASFSVKSQRYVGALGDGGDTFAYVVPPAIEALGEEAVARYEAQMNQIQQWYDGWVEALGGRNYEDARFVLPNGAETKLVMTMNARELMHFFNLRCCNRAQWEIRELAWAMLREVKQVAPYLFEQAGPSCIKGSCPEGKMSCGKVEAVRARAASLMEKDE